MQHDRLFPFKVIWDFSGLWRIWDFFGLWRIWDFFFARLVTRSLCSCVLMCFVLIYFYFVFGFSFGYVLVYSLDLLVYLPLVHSYSIFIIKNKIKSSSIGLLGVLFYYYFFFFFALWIFVLSSTKIFFYECKFIFLYV